MNRKGLVLQTTVLMALAFGLSSCTRPQHYRFEGMVDGQPRFCPVAGPFPTASTLCGDWFTDVHVMTYAATGAGDPMWSAEATSGNDADTQLDSITYGLTPKGWKTTFPARPLMPHIWYILNGAYFFREDENGHVTAMSDTDFYNQLNKRLNP